MVAATQRLRKNALPWDRVVWDIHRAYINENTKEVQLLFLPLEGEGLPRNIIGFFETLVYAAKPAEGEGDYLAKFIYFLRCLPHYDSDRVETYISRESSGAMKAVKGQTTGGSGFITDKQREYYDHYGRQGTDEDTLLLREEEGTGLMQEDSGDATGLLQEEEGTGLLREDEEGTGLLQEDEEDTGLLREEEEGTGLLQEDEEGTGLLNEENGTGRLESVHHYPTLYRVRTEEYIEVNKPVFRLGKERSYVDYFVTNNNAVSRGHADIITRGERFFVRDLNSKNRTFINGQEIPPQCECELLDGSRLTLGNEEFIFNT